MQTPYRDDSSLSTVGWVSYILHPVSYTHLTLPTKA